MAHRVTLRQMPALICKNGHLITGNAMSHPSSERFCPECGAELISKCPKCGVDIPGDKYFGADQWERLKDWGVHNNCENCGTPFPWAGKRHPYIPNLNLPNHKGGVNMNFNFQQIQQNVNGNRNKVNATNNTFNQNDCNSPEIFVEFRKSVEELIKDIETRNEILRLTVELEKAGEKKESALDKLSKLSSRISGFVPLLSYIPRFVSWVNGL